MIRDGSAHTPRRKVAQELAEEIERDVMARGWPVGELLGSESELIARYGVSRASFREAVRIVEHHTVADMRRGPNGGLIVTAPDPIAVQQPALLYLDYANVGAPELFQIRSALELACTQSVAESMTEDGIRRLRATLEQETKVAGSLDQGSMHDFHVLIAELTGNPAMRLFVDILTRLTFERTGHLFHEHAAKDDVHHAHLLIAEALIAGDGALAQHRMRAHLSAAASFYTRRPRRS